jgi:hypothetical protein
MRRRSRTDQPTLITSAPEDPDAEYEHRRRRYALMMAIRAAAVIAAALTYKVSVIMAVLFLVAGAVIPWCAVILANDGPPKRRADSPERMANTERALPPGNSDRTVDDE